MRTRTLIYAAFIATTGMHLVSPRALAQTLSPLEEQIVFVESVEIQGNPGISTRLILGALEVSAGKAYSRDELAARMQEAEQRLLAFGYFDKVDFALAKGAANGRYRVLLSLIGHNPIYSGFEETAQSIGYGIGSGEERTKSFTEQLFGGTRDLASTGAQLDVSYTRLDGNSTGYLNHDASDQAGISVVLPDIARTPLYAGIMAGSAHSKSNYSIDFSDIDGTKIGGTSSSRSMDVVATIGIRRGLHTFSLTSVRGTGSSQSTSVTTLGDGSSRTTVFNSTYWYTAHGLQAKFSQKPFLAAVEPGAVAAIRYGIGQFDSDISRSWATMLLDTYMQGPYALTPELVSSFIWFRGDADLLRSHDFGLTFEYVAPHNLVFGLEAACTDIVDADDLKSHLKRRAAAVVKYVSPTFITSLRLIYGESRPDPFATVGDSPRLGNR